MSKKKYYFFMVPSMLIGLFLIFYLPENQSFYVYLIPIVFGIIYYVWVKDK
ncbi:hypothetical protein MHI02_03810 [Oceanobacillus sp. FSL K6-0118]|uniref:hypothetical protein n=1 Tax=Oceanobacillus sp. FSL K6-0118 TaxID=2921418 RepID=UPI0030F94D70